MKKLIGCMFVVAAIAGCRSVEVVNNGQDYVRTANGDPVLVEGKPILFGKGWSVDHFQHWMMTDADAIRAMVEKDKIDFELNGLKSRPDAEGLKGVVDASFTGATNLAAKIGVAIATSGGSVGADAISGFVKQFVDKGGDVTKASVTVTDGKVTCTDGSCSLTGSCADGLCSE